MMILKEKLLGQALSLLEDVDVNKLEIVQVNVTTYDDGSLGLSIELTYPSENADGAKIGFKPEVSD